MSARLLVIGGPQAGTTASVAEGRPLVAGRDRACGLVLGGAEVSRRHVRFSLAGGVLAVERLSEGNGLYVNGRRCERADLGLWDTVVVGGHVLRVEALAGAALPAPLAVGADASLLACLLEIQRLLGTDDERMVERSLEALFLALPATRLSLFSLDAAGEPVQGHTVARSGLPSAHMSHGFARQVLAAGRATLLELDAAAHAAGWERTLRAQAVHTVIGVPVMRAGTPSAVLLADNLERPGALDRTHLAVLEAVARSLEHVFQRSELRRLAQERLRAEAEYEAAQAVQRVLIARDPAHLAGPWAWAARCRPALELGGDYYDVHQGDGRVSWVVADVSGKGLPAALVVSMLRIACKELQPRGLPPHELLLGLDRLLRGEMPGTMFVTAMAADLAADGRLRWCGLGHPAALLLRAAGDGEELESQPGMIGLMPAAVLARRARTTETRMRAGDRLCLLSDGVTESSDPAGAFLSDQAQRAALAGPGGPAAAIERLLAAIDRHGAGAPQGDDITVVVGDYLG